MLMAGLPSSNPLTNTLLLRPQFQTHTSLSCSCNPSSRQDQLFFLLLRITIVIMIIKSKRVKICKQWGYSGLERGSGINHCRWKEELLIQNCVAHTLLGPLHGFSWHDWQAGLTSSEARVLCVVSLPRWVSSLFTGEPTQPWLTH